MIIQYRKQLNDEWLTLKEGSDYYLNEKTSNITIFSEKVLPKCQFRFSIDQDVDFSIINTNILKYKNE